MGQNTGAYPADPSTTEGYFRISIGDMVGVVDSSGTSAEYQFFSDDAIDQLLSDHADADAAKSAAFSSMAAQLIIAAQDIQVDDIRIKTVEKANLMLKLAGDFAAIATANGAGAAFGVVGLDAASNTQVGYRSGLPRYTAETGF